MYRPEDARRILRGALGAVACALALAGCGGSGYGSSASGTTSGGSSQPTPEQRSRTGTKPSEVATSLHLSRSDCDALGAALTKRTGRTVRISSEPAPPLSGCQFTGHGIDVTISLDTSYGAHRRYSNRMVEAQQFGVPDPARVPHPVPGVGEPGAEGHNAEWIPSLGTLFAVRGNRWITVGYAFAGRSRDQRKKEAAAFTIQAFKLSAR